MEESTWGRMAVGKIWYVETESLLIGTMLRKSKRCNCSAAPQLHAISLENIGKL
ncbi:MAG: hypothetical protein GY799_19885 [Desulfobulbaceae bacterium]|nr:hypothetical protein [Desulfobulbaceae bacterium]